MAFRIMDTKLEWLAETERPKVGDILVIPANDHLWMLSGPGLEFKKILGKEIELEAVRQGPLEPGALAVTSGEPLGYRFLFHGVVTRQDLNWVPGAGRQAVQAAVARAGREKASSMILYPLYRGVHGRREDPAREMLAAFLSGLEAGSTLRQVSILCGQPDEKTMLHATMLRLLGEAHA